MNKELIEKIKGMAISREQRQSAEGLRLTCMNERNRVIKEVIKLIESYKPEELGRPDEEGWWFLVFENGKIFDCVQVVESDIGEFEVMVNDFYVPVTDNAYSCFKWINANAQKVRGNDGI